MELLSFKMFVIQFTTNGTCSSRIAGELFGISLARSKGNFVLLTSFLLFITLFSLSVVTNTNTLLVRCI